jgi:hypothetical protein
MALHILPRHILCAAHPMRIHPGHHITTRIYQNKKKCPRDFSPHVLAHERAGLKEPEVKPVARAATQQPTPCLRRGSQQKGKARGRWPVDIAQIQPEGRMLVTSPQKKRVPLAP